MKNKINGLKQHLRNTVTMTDFDIEKNKIWSTFDTFNQYCKYNDLENHMKEVKPLVNQCAESLEKYQKDNEEAKQIICRFDEVLLEKASKFTVDDIERQLKELAQLTQMSELKNYINYKTTDTNMKLNILEEKIQLNQKKVSEMIDFSTQSIQEDLKERIKEFLQARTISPEEVISLLSNKVDKCEILDLDRIKANRTEITNGDEKHKTTKRQLQHLSVLITSVLKFQNSELSSENPLLPNVKYLIKQSLNIFDWIKGKNPSLTPDLQISPRLEHNYTDFDNISLMKVRPISTCSKKWLKTPLKDEEMFRTYRSTSTNKRGREGFGSSFKEIQDHPIIKAKTNMVHHSKNRIKVNMSTSTYGEKRESLSNTNIPNLKFPNTKKNGDISRFKTSKKNFFDDKTDKINSLSKIKRSLKEELGI
mmetsp:Transcript_7921/g.7001  ORF Transcript_7921/g.7001 Transcript_7921/m.7001 type:complete len:421 (+) Transcript_7921:205-1467(+)